MPQKIDRIVAQVLHRGVVIPASPLALTAQHRLDERRQRALWRYYFAAGAGGLAVGVHTTQFAIRRGEFDLLKPVLELAAEEMDRADFLRDGDPGQPEVVLSPLTYHWRHAAEIEVYIQGAPAGERDTAVDDLLVAIGGAIVADPTLGGAVDHVETGPPDLSDEAVPGAAAPHGALPESGGDRGG